MLRIRRPLRLVGAALLLGSAPACGADLRRAPASSAPVFLPTSPDAVASDFPRSPLADYTVNGPGRFETAQAAQARCQTDVVVWVPLTSNFYNRTPPARQDREPGAFMCQGDASIEGDRPVERKP